MRTWSITEARANISKLVDEALNRGPQRVERRASERVVIVAESDWNRLAGEYPEIDDLILNAPFETDDLPKRRRARAIAADSA